MVSFTKITQSLCLLAIMATANAGSLRGDSSCTQIQCINGEGSDAACKASNTCVSDTKVLGANDKGCWTAYNEGSITAGEGFTGELRTVLCVKGIDSKIVPKIAVTEGAKVSKVTMNGGEGTAAEGSSIVAIETNGGSFKGTTTGVETVKTNGGSITINAAASAVNAATSNGGRITLSAASVAKVTTNGGSIVVTATSVKSVETNGGSITINKAHVESVETNGGSVNLTQGAAATKYSKSGGSCTGCPKADDDKRTLFASGSQDPGTGCTFKFQCTSGYTCEDRICKPSPPGRKLLIYSNFRQGPGRKLLTNSNYQCNNGSLYEQYRCKMQQHRESLCKHPERGPAC